MPVTDTFARRVRVQRLFNHGDDRLLVIPLDHGVSAGTIVHDGRLDRLIGQLRDGGADAVVLHEGMLRYLSPRWFCGMSLFVHLSASTVLASDPDAKYLVSTVENALRTGADGVSVQVNLGSRTEERQITDLAAVAKACARWGVPLLAMVYPRGPHIAGGHDPALVAHAVTLAVEIGADLVKTAFPGSVEAMAEVTRRCPIPVLVAGGPAGDGPEHAMRLAGDALRGGASGLAIGRHVFQAPDPAEMTRRLANLIHGR